MKTITSWWRQLWLPIGVPKRHRVHIIVVNRKYKIYRNGVWQKCHNIALCTHCMLTYNKNCSCPCQWCGLRPKKSVLVLTRSYHAWLVILKDTTTFQLLFMWWNSISPQDICTLILTLGLSQQPRIVGLSVTYRSSSGRIFHAISVSSDIE